LTLTAYPIAEPGIPTDCIETKRYKLYFARTAQQLASVQRLRAQVFYDQPNGVDEDQFDAVCHHLLVEHLDSGDIVGTYRMQTQVMADANSGFYSDQEYVLSDLPNAVLSQSVEIGRGCVDVAHRNGRVIHLLWRGLAMYLTWNKKRYLLGCSSLFSTEPRDGYAALAYFKGTDQVHPSIWAETRPKYACAFDGDLSGVELKVPKLLSAYMNLGARVCSPPALDLEFQSIDFLTLFDLEGLSDRARASFFGPAE
jgi:putative hemolysin